MNFSLSRVHYIIVFVTLAVIVSYMLKVSAEKEGIKINGFFGGKKKIKPVTSVGTEVGAQLVKQTNLPEQLSQPLTGKSNFEGEISEYKGQAPNGAWVTEAVSGETHPVFRVPTGAGHPPLVIMGASEPKPHLEIWETSQDKAAQFLKQRTFLLDPEQEKWIFYSPVATWSLPGNQVAIAVGYHDPIAREGLYIYNPNANEFRKVSVIEPDFRTAPPFSSFEVLPISKDATLLRYRTGTIRINAENYCYEYNHLLLFSSRYPNGLEILNLSIDDGNIQSWAMKDKTLWLQTTDFRKGQTDFVWSLDLSKVL